MTFREVAAAYLRSTFPPPPDCVLEVIEAECLVRFPVIAVGGSTDPDSPGAREYVARMREVLLQFVGAVNWQRLAEMGAGK